MWVWGWVVHEWLQRRNFSSLEPPNPVCPLIWSQRLSRQLWFFECIFHTYLQCSLPSFFPHTKAASWGSCWLSGNHWHLDFHLPNSSPLNTPVSVYVILPFQRHVYTHLFSSCKLCMLDLCYFTDEQSPSYLGPVLSLYGGSANKNVFSVLLQYSQELLCWALVHSLAWILIHELRRCQS